MARTLTWLASYPRSGNTFFRVVAHHLYGLQTSSIYNEPLEARPEVAALVGHEQLDSSLDDAPQGDGMCLVKTHDVPGADDYPAVYLVRDGRDALVSYAHYILSFEQRDSGEQPRRSFYQTLHDLIVYSRSFAGWGSHVLSWIDRPQTTVVRFEQLIKDPITTVSAALAEVGLVVHHETPAQGPPGFEELRRVIPECFRTGQVGNWKTELPADLQNLFWEHHGAAMQRLGYERSRPVETATTLGIVDPDATVVAIDERRNLLNFPADENMFQPQAAHVGRWHTGESFNRMPSKKRLRAEGLSSTLTGWAPAEPLIDETTNVIALGSCFASYFVRWLGDRGFNRARNVSPYSMLVRHRADFENVPSIAQQIGWAFGEFDPSETLWVDKDKSLVQPTEDERLLVRETLEAADVLIITLGLSEVWYDRLTGAPLWRAIPRALFNPERHAFKVLSVEETKKALEDIETIRARWLPNLKIIYTVSPVKLRATFRPVSALTANSVSKAIIRAALDEFLRSRPRELNSTYFYFPSYELVLELFLDPFEADNKHIYEFVVNRVLGTFARYYTRLAPDASDTLVAHDLGVAGDLTEQISELEDRLDELQAVCDERLGVIDRLKQAADERLAVIERVTDDANERLRLINELQASQAELAATVRELQGRKT